MKMYTKPSIEVKKFDVEDIIQTSGVVGTYDELSDRAKTIYNAYADDTNTDVTEKQVVEFHW